MIYNKFSSTVPEKSILNSMEIVRFDARQPEVEAALFSLDRL